MPNKRYAIYAIVGLVTIGAAVWYRARVYQTPPAPPTPTFAFVTGGSGPYWQITANGARAAARDLNVDVVVEMPSAAESLEQQMGILARLDLSTLNGVALSALDAEAQTRLINRMSRETNIVTFDSDAPLSDRIVYVGTKNYAAGKLCARVVEEAIPNGGKVAVLLANLTKANLIDRKAGFQDTLGHAAGGDERPVKYEVVDYLVDDGNDAKTAELIRATVSKHPDLACFVGMNAQHGPVLLRVFKEIGQLGKTALVTFDEEPDTLDGIEAGHIFATVAQDPYMYGYDAINMLSMLYHGDRKYFPIVGELNVRAEAIRKQNLAAFRERLRARSESP